MRALQTHWLLTESDFVTWVVPNTAFGIIAALAGPRRDNSQSHQFLCGLDSHTVRAYLGFA